MYQFFSSVFDFVLSPFGILIFSFLDSSMLFFLPAAIDTAVIVMVARYREWFWAFPLLAVAGSVAGATVTYYVGRKVGQAGLQKWISKNRLVRIRLQMERREVLAVGIAALLPPPFPLTPFVLTAGALGMDRRKFYITLASMRFVRFGVEAVLAVVYGRHILVWLKSDFFRYVAALMGLAALVGSVISIYQIVKRVR